MLTRRGLRIKTMQVLYMVSQDEALPRTNAGRLLDDNIRNTYRAFLFTLDFLTRLALQVQDESQRRKAKYIPQEEDMHFNTALFDNDIIQSLRTSDTFKGVLRKEKLQFTDEEEVISAIYNELKEWEPYQAYKIQESYTLDDHRKMLRSIVRKFLPTNEFFDQYMEDMIPTWAEEENYVLPGVDDVLKSMPLIPQREAVQFQFDVAEEDISFAHTLLEKCLLEEGRFDDLIEGRLQNWELERVSILDRILMKMSLTEFIHLPTVPLKVSINEYLEISKQYSTPKSREFINGVLDKLMIEMKNDGSIIKTGRGLIE